MNNSRKALMSKTKKELVERIISNNKTISSFVKRLAEQEIEIRNLKEKLNN